MTTRNAAEWKARCGAAAALYPSVLKPRFDDHLEQPPILGAIFRDLLRFDGDRDGEGRRVDPTLEVGMEALRGLMGDRFSMDPFDVSLERLAAGRTSAHLANKTGLSRSTIQRLRTGTMAPTREHIETVAAAFGRNPRWFVEYRAILLAELAMGEALRDPERSAALVGRLS